MAEELQNFFQEQPASDLGRTKERILVTITAAIKRRIRKSN
jgi:hypothetical protein